MWVASSDSTMEPFNSIPIPLRMWSELLEPVEQEEREGMGQMEVRVPQEPEEREEWEEPLQQEEREELLTAADLRDEMKLQEPFEILIQQVM